MIVAVRKEAYQEAGDHHTGMPALRLVWIGEEP